jgi:hypothetical protein
MRPKFHTKTKKVTKMSRRYSPRALEVGSFPDGDIAVLQKDFEQTSQSVNEASKEELVQRAEDEFNEVYALRHTLGEEMRKRYEEDQAFIASMDKILARTAESAGFHYDVDYTDPLIAAPTKASTATRLPVKPKKAASKYETTLNREKNGHRKPGIGQAVLDVMQPENTHLDMDPRASIVEKHEKKHNPMRPRAHANEVHHGASQPSLTAEVRRKPKQPRRVVTPVAPETPDHIAPLDLAVNQEEPVRVPQEKHEKPFDIAAAIEASLRTQEKPVSPRDAFIDRRLSTTPPRVARPTEEVKPPEAKTFKITVQDPAPQEELKVTQEVYKGQEKPEAAKSWFANAKDKFGIRLWSVAYAAKDAVTDTYHKLLNVGTSGLGYEEALKKKDENRKILLIGTAAIGALLAGRLVMEIAENINVAEATAGVPSLGPDVTNGVEPTGLNVQDNLNGYSNAQVETAPSAPVQQIPYSSESVVTPPAIKPTFQPNLDAAFNIAGDEHTLDLFSELKLNTDLVEAHKSELLQYSNDFYAGPQGDVRLMHPGWLSPEAQQYIESLR